MIGIGGRDAYLAVYIGNRPPLDSFTQQQYLRALEPGEIAQIAQLTGNHWRKVFNCYAKLIFEIDSMGFKTWQSFRDQQLLQSQDSHLLLFSPPQINNQELIHIVTGKNYFESLSLNTECLWLDKDFAIDYQKRIIVCPYFDYRQLSNVKISFLKSLILKLSNST